MKKNKLLENTIMLYLLTFSNYFFNLITIPYQTRILGPEIYGKISFCIAVSTYFKLVYDFGFILSATENISKNRNNVRYISNELVNVLFSKIILILLSIIPLIIVINVLPILKSDKLLFMLYFIYIAIDSLEPDFLYRGMENMKPITVRNVLVKAFFTIMIFVFLKNKNHYYLIPIFNIIGAFISLILVFVDTKKRFKIKYRSTTFRNIIKTINNSKVFFFSRIASTLYGATNTLLLGIIYPSGPNLGYYSSSEKLLSACRQASSPIADSVYPNMIKTKNFNLIKKILKITMPIIITCGIIGFIFANKICLILFGKEYADSAIILRYMIPIMIITLPTYLLGFPTMSPLGLSKEANLSVIFSSIYHAFSLILLLILDKLTMSSICILTITTEFLVLIIRIYYIMRKRREVN